MRAKTPFENEVERELFEREASGAPMTIPEKKACETFRRYNQKQAEGGEVEFKLENERFSIISYITKERYGQLAYRVEEYWNETNKMPHEWGFYKAGLVDSEGRPVNP